MLHHAYYIEDALSSFETYRLELKPIWARAFERFGIDEARELGVLASLKNYTDTIFLIGVSSITSEAQQAILKLFEEPQRGTTFFLLIPHGILLPTLRSRMLKYAKSVDSQSDALPGVMKFLGSQQKVRSEIITKILKDDDGARERAREFVSALEKVLSKKITNSATREALEDLQKIRAYINDRSPSLKMLLEHLAVTLPRFDLKSGVSKVEP